MQSLLGLSLLSIVSYLPFPYNCNDIEAIKAMIDLKTHLMRNLNKSFYYMCVWLPTQVVSKVIFSVELTIEFL